MKSDFSISCNASAISCCNGFVVGFEKSNRGCCGTRLIEVGVTCNSNTSFVYPDVSKYVFWDVVHSTKKTYDLTAKMVLKIVMDKDISQLLQ